MVRNTPVMGWNSWNTFAENISEQLIMEAADSMVNEGLLAAGYEYLVIDDCWSLKERDKNGRLQANPEKFPHGMKYVADYVHSKGLKFGMYSCSGTMTCAGYPASFEHEYVDAATFAEWGVDLLKYDYCYKPKNVPGFLLYRRMGNALANCGRDILFNSCSWGADNTKAWIRATGSDMWRSTGDIVDNWKSIKSIHEQQLEIQAYNAKGCFNDMDMLVVGMNGKGNVGLGGCSYEEYKTHFSLWCMLGSPLQIGCDVRNMTEETKSILLNKELIAINQDPEFRQPFLATGHPWGEVDNPVNTNDNYVWVRQLSGGDLAIGLFNMGDDIGWNPINFQIDLYDLGLGTATGRTLKLHDLWNGTEEIVKNDVIMKSVKPHDCIIYRAEIIEI